MDPRSPAPPAAPVPTGDWGTAPVRPREPQPGEQIGPYRLIRQIGRGGMAVVFEADDTELPRRVALKVLVDPDPQAKLRFVREAHAQAKVSHDNVVTIYRVGEDHGVSYIAMPVLNGQSLAQALTATPKPPLSAVVRIASEMAEGLSAAHAAGLIHRDIKPANVWLEAPKWRVKILDFGLVRDPHANTQIDITMQGHVVGTPAYMSPEQAAGQDVDHRTDLWSLGVVLYQMTTGKRPFNDDNTVNLMTAIVSQDVPAPVDLAPDLPAKLSDLIRRLMAKNPARRPATAAAVSAELDAIGKSLTAPPVVVMSLPSAVPDAAPSGVNPWNDLEATETDLSRAATPAVTKPAADGDSYEGPPRRRARGKGDGRRSAPKWPLIAGGVVAVLLAAGALVLALDALGGKSKPTEPTPQPDPAPRPVPAPKPAPKKEEPKRDPAPPVPESNSEREAAEKLIRFANLVVATNEGPKVVPANTKLPPGPLSVAVIDFTNIPDRQFKESFVSDTFLPAVSHLRALERVQDGWGLALSTDHLRHMAGMPLARTLQVLQMSVLLTPEAVPELKRFGALTEVIVVPPEPSDDLFLRLADLTHLRRLSFSQLNRSNDLTDKGWNAIAGMPLDLFAMWGSRGASSALKAFTARRGPLPTLRFVGGDLSDEALKEHLKPTTELRELEVRFTKLTDAATAPLVAVKSLTTVSVVQDDAGKLTYRGLMYLHDNRPEVKLLLNGRPYPPPKK